MEFLIAQSSAKPALYPPIVRTPPASALVRGSDPGSQDHSPGPFGAWLLGQAKRPGSLGELAKAVKLDRGFPKSGSVDDVRRHFGSIGAEGDAFEALDDAEREYDRLG
jgi:hypothetical protein